MKNYLPFIAFFLFFACVLNVTTRAINRTNCREYSADLQEQGYSKLWADHKSAVEFGYIEADELYQAIQED